MNRPPRLLDASSNDALRSLLDAGLDDAPSPNALPKVAAALGLASATVAASGFAVASAGAKAATAKGVAVAGAGTPLAGGAAVASAASASTAGLAGGGSVLALGKTLLVSMVSAGAFSVGAVAVHEYVSLPRSLPSAPMTAQAERAREAPARTAQPAPRSRAAQAPAADVPAVADTVTTSSTLVQPSQRAATRATSVSPAAPTNAAAAPQRAGVLAREVRQIDAARQALAAKDSAGALAAIDSYERSRVVGLLDREALLLKIEALSQQQDLEQAKALARQYLQRFPTDTHAPRLRALVGATPSSVQAFPNE